MRNKIIILTRSGKKEEIELACPYYDIVEKTTEIQGDTRKLKRYLDSIPKVKMINWNVEKDIAQDKIGSRIYNMLCS